MKNINMRRRLRKCIKRSEIEGNPSQRRKVAKNTDEKEKEKIRQWKNIIEFGERKKV